LIIMLGTNDANIRDEPLEAITNCTDANASNCAFAQDYASMIEVARTLGVTQGVHPKIFLAIPPPLMSNFYYGMNQVRGRC
jgi:hypothetical protein